MMKMNSIILIVEDEKSIADSLAFALKKEGFETVKASDGEAAISTFRKIKPDLVILDLMLPKIAGDEVCRRIRKESDVPILVISAKDSEMDKVVILELGADDYVTKPFSIREVIARIKGMLRRTQQVVTETQKSVTTVGPFFLDRASHIVKVAGEKIELTPKEFELLALLMENAGRVLTVDIILDRIWGYDFYGSTKTVTVYIKKLREKIGVPANGIQNVRGIGYKLEVGDL